MEIEFDKLNILERNFNLVNIKNCSYCNELFTEELWCKECDPFRIMEGWTSGNSDIDKFIKDTMYKPRYSDEFLEWVPFDRFTDKKEIGEGGFAKVYSAIWIDGKSNYYINNDGDYKKVEADPKRVALKRLNGSQNMSDKYLNELKIHWNLFSKTSGLSLYGITKDPETKEFMMIIKFADKGNLRSSLINNFNNILWKNKIVLLFDLSENLQDLHKLGYFHKDFHSGNILRINDILSFISDFGLSGPVNGQKSDDKVYGVLPYIAPEVLNGEHYTTSSDIYSFGVVMAELSSGKPPFYNKKHDLNLALAICNGLRPEFGKGTPEFYKKLAYRCMNANSNERPTAKELKIILTIWRNAIYGYYRNKGKEGKEIKTAFEEADKEIPNISTSYEKNSDAVYTSRAFNFSNLLSKPVNSSIITSYINEESNEVHDSQLVNLEIPDLKDKL
ncbi:uncharacterized protein OCT59_004699 [Rhizophagus irregularis]|uniref:Kinase-like domain-containing protein n=2 Tax=Rhizophagus irregularis (strain DAOM 181602 / DAOM 197198 / MUCL 43194) TaxID=747089 RepID=A0A2P4NZE9_RHIID|nr:kinase-like domain-containing protein [Rhizophagus irregularis DAOM 181602=DAOM 197198]POG58513.1 kinase-like domain-containing protein [Rhizophagus irregularis DAOM 181602=DAOM 197198]UZO13194.1 hypothetical protein OCT59_004699 [Rhizophagus irregularis]|eukprot:XP_025165379.1 kinase-like domain-containing protein [Rhizophagus irregularis DAOM 181602=DAOM 197198]